jgi:heme-degrading monooxygenase HmoA
MRALFLEFAQQRSSDMYGTIAKMRIIPGKEKELEALSRESSPQIPGFVFQHVYRMDADPNEVYLVVGFESKEAYLANAKSPEQNERYMKYRSLFAGDPEWHDGEIVFSVP